MRIGLFKTRISRANNKNVILVFVRVLAFTTISYQILDTGSLTCFAQIDLIEISMMLTNVKTAI